MAVGDSFTEGVGDPAPELPNGVRGWADRVAAVLAARDPDFGYANLAIRGRKLRPILAEQLEPALALRPDLVTVYAGANDILRPKVDVDALLWTYDEAIEQLTASGAKVVVFTAHDPGSLPVFSTLRDRFRDYSEGVRAIATRRGATVVDFWNIRDYRDERLWDFDRMHMSPAGHQRMAAVVLGTLDVDHDLRPVDLPEPTGQSMVRRATGHARWAGGFLAPWLVRRVRGVSSGDSLSPRYPELVRPQP